MRGASPLPHPPVSSWANRSWALYYATSDSSGRMGSQNGFAVPVLNSAACSRAPSTRVSVQQDSASQEIEFGPAISLPFDELHPVDLPLQLSIGPGKPKGGFDSRPIGPDAVGKAP